MYLYRDIEIPRDKLPIDSGLINIVIEPQHKTCQKDPPKMSARILKIF